MNERSRWSRRAKSLGLVLAALIPLARCGEDSPTGPTLDPTASLAAVEVVLSPATPTEGYTHAFTVHATIREARGVPIVVTWGGVRLPVPDYTFPSRESVPGDLAIPAFGVGTMDALIENHSEVPCQMGIDVIVLIKAVDRLPAEIPTRFNCSTGYWPL